MMWAEQNTRVHKTAIRKVLLLIAVVQEVKSNFGQNACNEHQNLKEYYLQLFHLSLFKRNISIQEKKGK